MKGHRQSLAGEGIERNPQGNTTPIHKGGGSKIDTEKKKGQTQYNLINTIVEHECGKTESFEQTFSNTRDII